ncbi:MAG: glycosyltransferase family 9 protein [Cetobacterium sp.]|uniref:glycosyltransferase family 9 protein n=1 Tax=Cetobacterium sp. TaxID=2071632 RepID=UPI003F3A137B
MDKKYLKKSYIQEGINLYLVRFILSFFKSRFKPTGKVLIKSCDGIGDVLVRTKLMEEIEKKYGKENIYVLMKSGYTKLGDMLGYKTIGYSRKDRKNLFSRLKKMYELNSMGFSTYINVEFSNDITVGNLFIPERIGKHDLDWQVERNNKYYTKSYTLENNYVMDQVTVMGREILGKNFKREEMLPDLKNIFGYGEENIVIAVGSTEKERVCSPTLMSRYLQEVSLKYPNKKLLLVGNGERQNNYAKKIVDIMNNKNVKNLVDKTSLQEVFEIVSKSYLFIGFESGLYNLSFVTKKKGVILFREKVGPFVHDVSWLKILIPKQKKPLVEDKDYPNDLINSITIEEFKEALREVTDEKKFSY